MFLKFLKNTTAIRYQFQRGALMVEAAIAIPLFLTIVMVLIQLLLVLTANIASSTLLNEVARLSVANYAHYGSGLCLAETRTALQNAVNASPFFLKGSTVAVTGQRQVWRGDLQPLVRFDSVITIPCPICLLKNSSGGLLSSVKSTAVVPLDDLAGCRDVS